MPVKDTYSASCSEKGYVSRLWSNDSAEIRLSQEMRYRYFTECRGWTPPCPSRLETDCYDAHALHLAVLRYGEAAAYMRLLPWRSDVGFMLDCEFRCLLSEDYEMKRHNAVEISRLAVSESLGIDERIESLELLFKLFYHISLKNGHEHFYIVVEPGWLRVCRQRFGFRFIPISPIYTFPDGTRTVAGYASLQDLETSMREYSLEKFQWYASGDDESDEKKP